MTEFYDQHQHHTLVRAELEDMKLLHTEKSAYLAYLEFWRITDKPVAPDMQGGHIRAPTLRTRGVNAVGAVAVLLVVVVRC